MKRLLAIFLSVAMIFTVIVSGCGNETCIHEYGNWTVTKSATCTVDGTKERVCTLCGKTETETIKAVHNKYSVWTVEESRHYRICRTCGEKFDVGEHEFINGKCKCGKCLHEYGEWVVTKAATCAVYGTRERVCSRCGETETENFKGEHDNNSLWTIEKNKHYKVCGVCGEKFDMGIHEYVNGRCKCGKKEVVETVWDIPDYTIEIEEGRDVRVLFLADTQIIDSSQVRSPDRIPWAMEMWAPEHMEDLCFTYIRKAVETADPDLVILLGDNVYGEFDDKGTSLMRLVEVMDSFHIPWGVVNGNHDNESVLGAKWQNAQYENAKYCLFKKGDTDGNGNYTIAVKQGSKIIRMFYLMDSNHCVYAADPEYNEVVTSCGFTRNQVEWLYERMDRIEKLNGAPIKSTLCFHVATNEYALASQQYGVAPPFGIGVSVLARNGDFGHYGQKSFENYNVPSAYDLSFLEICKKFGVDTTFCGHSHQMNTSILYEGIRWTFCLKTGEYDSHTEGELGGTQMTFNDTSFSVQHLYYS